MTRKSPKQQSSSNKGGKDGILSQLSGAEATAVLNCLLRRHPELQAEAEAAAADLLSAISFTEVADMVESAVLQFDYDDLNDRAGSHSSGYVEPVEAAWELLEEAVEPFLDDLKRYLDLGLEEQARELCQGILLGLYRVRGQRNDILEWAEDFPDEAAGNVVEVWARSGQAGRQSNRRLSGGFVAQQLPEWEWITKPDDKSK